MYVFVCERERRRECVRVSVCVCVCVRGRGRTINAEKEVETTLSLPGLEFNKHIVYRLLFMFIFLDFQLRTSVNSYSHIGNGSTSRS